MLSSASVIVDSGTNHGKYWSFDPKVTFLNHGSFGACPLPVLTAQQKIRQQIEQEPVSFFIRELEPLLDVARVHLATFIGVDAQDLVFVPNATTGINAVLRSLQFQPGDELLTTDHEYNASANVLNFIAAHSGAKVVVAKIPFPIAHPQQIRAAIMPCVTPKTRLALLDHVTSQTGLIFPIAELAQELTSKGIDLLVDGAHAPGMLPLNLAKIGATYYTGNCHKWLCAPKGAAFLYVQRDRQTTIRPTTISHGANSSRRDRSRFHLEFDWMGTTDPSPYLSVPIAIDFMGSLYPGGWSELMAKNHLMAINARRLICYSLGLDIPCPDEMIGAMASIPLTNGTQPETELIPYLQNALWEKFQIEVPIIFWPSAPKRLIRISAQVYNHLTQYEKLAIALQELKNAHLI